MKAVVEFTGYSPADGIDTDVQCYFEDADNPSAVADQGDLNSRVLTSGVPWKNIEEWKDNYAYQTPQLRDILQGVINRDGWASGNNILFTAKNDGLDSYRLWSAIEHRGGLERARLKVSWIAPKKLDPPVITPAETFQLAAFTCTIRAFPTDASIYYTLDGNPPHTHNILYSAPFQITASKEVRARTYKDYWTYSDISSKVYTVLSQDYYYVFSNELGQQRDIQGREPIPDFFTRDIYRSSYTNPNISMGTYLHPYEPTQVTNSGFFVFNNVGIPRGTTIQSAHLILVGGVEGPWWGSTFITKIRAEAADDATPASGVVWPYKSIDTWDALVPLGLTSNVVYWSMRPSEVIEGEQYTSPDISDVIQEVTDRSGWVSGNQLQLILTPGNNDGNSWALFGSGQKEITYRPILAINV